MPIDKYLKGRLAQMNSDICYLNKLINSSIKRETQPNTPQQIHNQARLKAYRQMHDRLTMKREEILKEYANAK